MWAWKMNNAFYSLIDKDVVFEKKNYKKNFILQI